MAKSKKVTLNEENLQLLDNYVAASAILETDDSVTQITKYSKLKYEKGEKDAIAELIQQKYIVDRKTANKVVSEMEKIYNDPNSKVKKPKNPKITYTSLMKAAAKQLGLKEVSEVQVVNDPTEVTQPESVVNPETERFAEIDPERGKVKAVLTQLILDNRIDNAYLDPDKFERLTTLVVENPEKFNELVSNVIENNDESSKKALGDVIVETIAQEETNENEETSHLSSEEDNAVTFSDEELAAIKSFMLNSGTTYSQYASDDKFDLFLKNTDKSKLKDLADKIITNIEDEEAKENLTNLIVETTKKPLQEETVSENEEEQETQQQVVNNGGNGEAGNPSEGNDGNNGKDDKPAETNKIEVKSGIAPETIGWIGTTLAIAGVIMLMLSVLSPIFSLIGVACTVAGSATYMASQSGLSALGATKKIKEIEAEFKGREKSAQKILDIQKKIEKLKTERDQIDHSDTEKMDQWNEAIAKEEQKLGKKLGKAKASTIKTVLGKFTEPEKKEAFVKANKWALGRNAAKHKRVEKVINEDEKAKEAMGETIETVKKIRKNADVEKAKYLITKNNVTACDEALTTQTLSDEGKKSIEEIKTQQNGLCAAQRTLLENCGINLDKSSNRQTVKAFRKFQSEAGSPAADFGKEEKNIEGVSLSILTDTESSVQAPSVGAAFTPEELAEQERKRQEQLEAAGQAARTQVQADAEATDAHNHDRTTGDDGHSV